MSIAKIILDLTCEVLECEENPCPYAEDKRMCPKQIECMEMCDLMCTDAEED